MTDYQLSFTAILNIEFAIQCSIKYPTTSQTCGYTNLQINIEQLMMFHKVV